jgi:hypothetical protein
MEILSSTDSSRQEIIELLPGECAADYPLKELS